MATETLLAAPTKTYDGNAIANTAFGTPGDAPAWTGTLEYTYYEGTGTGGTKLSGAPKDAGTYTVAAAIPDSDATYTGAHAAITFTISQATVTIKANDKSAYVGDTAPALTAPLPAPCQRRKSENCSDCGVCLHAEYVGGGVCYH